MAPRVWPICVVTLLLLAGRCRRCLQPVDDHSTGDGSEDQRGRNQDRAHHAKPVEDAAYHVITNYQRRSRSERSLKSSMAQTPVANRST